MPILPISSALREAKPESLHDLFSRDVEPMEDYDIDRIIRELRANRSRQDIAESAARVVTPRVPRTPRVSTIVPGTKPDKDVDISELEI